MTTARPGLDTLLRHQEWVRALAASLVRDPAGADDVAQQTMLEAVTRAPADLRQPKGWLARVARNAARAWARQERRRARREDVVAREAAAATAPDPAATLQRAAAHKRVVDTLFALPEPYHTVVVLRFFDDVDAHEIARRLDRPVATVRTQLQRGLARMRERLDAEFGGDRRAWCAAFAPLLPAGTAGVGVPGGALLGALLMTKWMLSAAAALLVLAFVVWQLDAARDPTPLADGSGSGTGAIAVAAADDAAPDAARMPGEAPPRDAVPAASVPASPRSRRGRLVTLDGRPLAGLVVASRDPRAPHRSGDRLVVGSTSMDLAEPGNRAAIATAEGREVLANGFGAHAGDVLALLEGRQPARPRATTDGSGRFEVERASERDELELEAEGLMVFGEGHLPGEPDPVFVTGPAVTISGTVRDQRGAPLAGAFVSVGFTLESLPGIGARLRGAGEYRSWNATTDVDGRFGLGRVPAHDALRVLAQKRGHRHVAIATSSASLRQPVDWTLPDDDVVKPTLAGVVRHPDGRPAPRARVCFGQDQGVADDAGRFAFGLTSWSERTLLMAYVAGHEPCLVEGLGPRLRADQAAGAALELRLGGPARSIAGRVVGADGQPLAGLRVVAADAHFVGATDQLLENVIGDQGDVVTDGDGRFELRGLSSRPYTVRAVDPRTLLVVDAAGVAAGTTGLELRADAAPFAERVEGVLIDRHGAPVAGARVALRAVLHAGGGSGFTKALPRRDGVTSDGAGRFVLQKCPRRGVQLTVAGDGIAWTVANVPLDGGPMRVEVVRRLRFRLTSLGGAAATAFEVHDATGVVLHTTAHRPGVQSTHARVGLREPASFYEVDDRATTLVFFRGGQEVRREGLALRSGDVTEIAF
jgi:RNA polymerase sigma factor (sigma-70 family)